MAVKEKLFLITIIVSCLLLQARGADKYTDGNRPYEFGFNIDGEQHRHEKKDEKGLIEGEFGFITADGVYHVTVYATDEQGRFKILSMKNIRVKPYPTYTAKSSSSARQGHSLDLPVAEQSASPQVPSSPTTSTLKPISIEPPARSCSHCSIPTTSTAAPVVPFSQPNYSNQITGSTPKFPQGVKPESTLPGQGFGSIPQSNVPNYPAQAQNNIPGPQGPLSKELVPPQYSERFGPAPAQSPQAGGQIPAPGFGNPQSNFPGVNDPIQPGSPNFPQQPIETPPSSPVGRTPKRLDAVPPASSINTQPNYLQRDSPIAQGAVPTKPTLISAQMQIVDKNTDIYRRGPGERDGLPDGITKNDMTNLLYTFNYTVGFHGHFEEGYANGNKQGYYFVTGRNGVRTRIDYTADSTGFHPKISQEVLDLLSDDVPKPETEKEEKYGLKGYEFKWLYYPVDTKGR